MFSVDSSFTHLAVPRDRVLTLLQSINAISVKVPGVQAAPATAFFAAWELGDGAASAVIYLYYTRMHRCAAYAPEPREFAITKLPAIIEEAKEFLESMGFMLDDPGFGTLAADQKQRLVSRTPLFFRDLEAFAAARENDEPAGAAGFEQVDTTPGVVAPVEAAPVVDKPAQDDRKRAEAIGRLLMSF